MVTTIQTAKVHGLDDAERVGIPAFEGHGTGAEGQVTIPERAERGDDPGTGGAGVREPRRPRPSGDGDSVEPPSDDAND
jgi:hypothetical protein